MKKTLLLSAFAFTLLQGSSFAQQSGFCGAQSPEQILKADKSLSQEEKEARLASINAEKQKNMDYYLQHQKGKKTGDITIPVVFHIIHEGGVENISYEQILEGLNQINMDLSYTNPDRAEVEPEFADITVDMGIRMRLATIDPNGGCTNGVIRHKVEDAYFDNENSIIENYKVQFGWPTDKYYNIYVVGRIGCDGGSCTLGYANYASYYNWMRSTWGAVMVYNTVGAPPSSSGNGTITHELGHSLNLPHPWGNSNSCGDSGNCSSDDGIDDTPNTIGNCSTCNLSVTNCGSKDNVQNFMDYSFCYSNFTQGQKDVVLAAMNGSPWNTITDPANVAATGADYESIDELTAICTAEFDAPNTNICPGTAVTYTDYSYYNPESWEWTFEGGTPSVSTDQNPTVTYNTPGTYDVTLTVTNQSGSKTTVKSSYVTVLEAQPTALTYEEGFEGIANISETNDLVVNNVDGDSRTFKLKTNAGFESSQSAYMDARGVNNTSDELISSSMDISNFTVNKGVVEFKYAFAPIASVFDDRVKIYFSRDCGETWVARTSISPSSLGTADAQSSAFTPDGTQWETKTVKILGSDYYNSGFRYKVEYLSHEGNAMYFDNFNVYDESAVSVEELNNENAFSVYPSPASNKAFVELKTNGNAQIELIDLTGRVISSLESTNRTTSIDLNDVATGLYVVRVSVNGEQFSKRLVVNK